VRNLGADVRGPVLRRQQRSRAVRSRLSSAGRRPLFDVIETYATARTAPQITPREAMTKRPYVRSFRNAFIVDDMEAAIGYWTEVMPGGSVLQVPRDRLRGSRFSRSSAQSHDLAPAIAYSGDLMIELISAARSFDLLRVRRRGAHRRAPLRGRLPTTSAWRLRRSKPGRKARAGRAAA
jgi:hypothetical protein